MNKYNIGDTLYYFNGVQIDKFIVQVIYYDKLCKECTYNNKQYESMVSLSIEELIDNQIKRLDKLKNKEIK